MQITLIPQDHGHIDPDKLTSVSVSGLVVTIDGTDYDLSAIPEGGQAEAEQDSPFIGVVTREEVKIKYHYNASLALPNQSTDWADYTFDITEGEVPCPIQWKPVEEPIDVIS